MSLFFVWCQLDQDIGFGFEEKGFERERKQKEVQETWDKVIRKRKRKAESVKRKEE